MGPKKVRRKYKARSYCFIQCNVLDSYQRMLSGLFANTINNHMYDKIDLREIKHDTHTIISYI